MKVEHFKFWGLGVRQTKGSITIDQNLCFIYIPNRYKERKEGLWDKNYDLSQEKTELKTVRSNDVGIHLDMTGCSIWYVSDE